MDYSGFTRTPNRSVKLLGTCVRYLRYVETSIGARGPDFLGGSATVAIQSLHSASLDVIAEALEELRLHALEAHALGSD